MARLCFIVIVLAALHSLWNRCSSSGSVARSAGSDVVLETRGFDVHFSEIGDLSGWFMLFGGSHMGNDWLSHVWLSGIEIGDARALYRRYPDFHMCKSPGSTKAQASTKGMEVVAADPRTRRALDDAVNLFKKRFRNKGERVCVGLTGKRLSLDSVRRKPDGTDITRNFRGFKRNGFYFAERVQVQDCGSLLREG